VSILDSYHKNDKKSRSSGSDRPSVSRIDIFLIIGIVIVLVLIVVNRTLGKVNSPDHTNIMTNITISSQGEFFFGKEAVDSLIQEFELIYPDMRIQTADQEEADIVFFSHSTLDQPEQLSVFQITPLVSFVDLFFYNIDILKDANCDRPPKTRAEFITTAKAIAQNNPPSQKSIYAFALGFSHTDPMALRRHFYPWIWADGGELYQSESTTLSRTAINTIAFLGQLDNDGLLAPQSFEKNGTQRLEEFARGEVAMMIASAQSILYLRQNAQGINFDITTIPTTLQGKSRLGLSGIYAGINSVSSLPDEAGIFLAFVAEKDQLLAETLGAVPGIVSGTFPNEYIIKDAMYSKAWDIYEAADIVEYNLITEDEIREKLAEVIK
jgi:hypothetical protein